MLRHGLRSSTFLASLAPRALPRFFTTTKPLIPVRLTSPEQVSLLHVTQTSHHSVSNHLMSPVMAFSCYPSASRTFQFLLPGTSIWVSPFTSRLANFMRLNRVRILRTGGSPPVASHPASWRRSYFRIQTGEHLSEEDFHLFYLGALTGALAAALRAAAGTMAWF